MSMLYGGRKCMSLLYGGRKCMSILYGGRILTSIRSSWESLGDLPSTEKESTLPLWRFKIFNKPGPSRSYDMHIDRGAGDLVWHYWMSSI